MIQKQSQSIVTRERNERRWNIWTFVFLLIVTTIAFLSTMANAESPTPTSDSIAPKSESSATDVNVSSKSNLSQSLAGIRALQAANAKQMEEGETISPTQPLIGQLFRGLALCLIIFFAGVSIYKKFINPRQEALANNIEIISRRSVGPRTSLLVVRTEGRRFFLSLAGDEVQLLAPLDEEFSLGDALAELPMPESQIAAQFPGAANG